MLLAFRDREGTTVGGTMYPYAVGGAIVAELIVAQRVKVEEDGKRRFLSVVDPTPLQDPLIDEWLGSMAATAKPKEVSTWVSEIAGTKDLKHRIAKQLCRRGILRTDEDKVLWIFTRKIYPELDPRPERDLVDRLGGAIFGDGDVEARTAILVAIAHQGGLLSAVLHKKRLQERKERIESIAEGSVAAGATADAIEALQVALMVTAIVPAIVTTTIITT
jgi:golgi phosphoprotein 3